MVRNNPPPVSASGVRTHPMRLYSWRQPTQRADKIKKALRKSLGDGASETGSDGVASNRGSTEIRGNTLPLTTVIQAPPQKSILKKHPMSTEDVRKVMTQQPLFFSYY